MATFSETYEKYIHNIEAAALSQYVAGCDYDDIVAEMLGCLWKAWKSYDPIKGTFSSYWWSLWLNRRRDINRNATRRPVLHPVWFGNDEGRLGSYNLDPSLDAPLTSSPTARAVWTLIVNGFTPAEIREITGLSKRAYYAVIDSWRTKEVRDLLKKL